MKRIAENYRICLENLIYNVGLKTRELKLLWRNPLWRRLQTAMALSYLTDPPWKILKRENLSGNDFIYGETPLLTAKRILEDGGAGKNTRLIDLGSGRGLVVFAGALLLDMEAAGVEAVRTFTDKSNRIREKMNLRGVTFINGDITEQNLNGYNLVYLAGTTFSDGLMKRIVGRLETMPAGTTVISLSQSLKSEAFVVVRTGAYAFSWGEGLVYFHEKIH